MKHRLWFTGNIFAILSILLSSCTKQTFDTGIAVGTLIDGNGGIPQKNKLLVINGRKIVFITDASEKNRYKFKTFVDARNQFVVPGLIEMHGHVTMTHRNIFAAVGTPDGVQLTVNYDRPAAEWTLRTLLEYGVTTVREAGDFLEEGLQLKRDIGEGRIPGPFLFTCGPLIESEPSTFRQMSVSVNSEAEVRNEVQRQAKAGVDFVKLYSSLKPELSKIAIDEAHKAGIRALGHVKTTSCRQAIEFGIDALVHPLEVMGVTNKDSIETILKIMGQKRIPMDIQAGLLDNCRQIFWKKPTASWAPTWQAMPDTIKKGFAQQLSFYVKLLGITDETRFCQELDSAFRLQVSMARKAGVRLFLGSDFGNPVVIPGFSLHDEMQAFQTFGYTPMEIIKMVTHDPAEWLGILDRKGTLEVAKDADFVILTADPLVDIANLLKIDQVYREGKKVR